MGIATATNYPNKVTFNEPMSIESQNESHDASELGCTHDVIDGDIKLDIVDDSHFTDTVDDSVASVGMQQTSGDAIECYWPDDGTWLPAVILQVNDDHSFTITWDEDLSESVVPADYVRHPAGSALTEPPAKRVRI